MRLLEMVDLADMLGRVGEFEADVSAQDRNVTRRAKKK
jgi:hypothetical protein